MNLGLYFLVNLHSNNHRNKDNEHDIEKIQSHNQKVDCLFNRKKEVSWDRKIHRTILRSRVESL